MGAPRQRARFWLLLAILLGAASLLLPSGGPEVSAHALLVRAEPPANGQVREPPSLLTLYFSEPLERRFSRARVTDQDGRDVVQRIEFDDADDALMRIYLEPLQPGYITVNWETVSTVDGHRISGSYPVIILNADGSLPQARPEASRVEQSGAEARPPRVAAKAFLLFGGAALTGAFAFLIFVAPAIGGPAADRARQVMERRALYLAQAALLVLAVAGIADLALQASDINAGVGTVLDTRWGERWLLRHIFLAMPLVATVLLLIPGSGSAARRFLASVALVACLGNLALMASVSHAAAGGGAFWAVSSDFVHLVAASVWTGLLAVLVLLFLWSRRNLARGEKYGVLAPALSRFSLLALGSVALLLFTGVVNASIEVGRLSDLTDTDYGIVMLIKLALLVPLMGVAGYNAYVLRPELHDAPLGNRNTHAIVQEQEGRLSRLVRWELGAAAAVLAVTALLSQLSPTRGRISEPEELGTFTATIVQQDISTTLVVDPNQPGINTFEVYLAGAIDTVEEVSLRIRQRGSDDEARVTLEPSNAPVYYIGQGAFLSAPGDWTVAVNLRRSAGNDALVEFPVKVAAPGGVAVGPRTGGTFASPLPDSLEAYALVVGAALLAAGLVAGSVLPVGLAGGYISLAADELTSRLQGSSLRPFASLAALIIVGIGLGMIVGSHLHNQVSPEEASRNNPVASTPDSIARGRMLFAQNCTQCHGETGRGDGPLAGQLPLQPANLYDHIPYHPDEFFFNAISRGIGNVMPGFASSLSEEDRWNILNFLREQFGQPPADQ